MEWISGENELIHRILNDGQPDETEICRAKRNAI